MKSRPVWALIAAAIVIVSVCYSNSLPNDFIQDDYQIVALNASIRTITPLEVFKTPYWGQNSNAGIYRPLTIFSYSMEYPLWHRWPAGYRLTNMALHTVNGLLVFVVARSILPVAGAYAAAAIYLAHPVHSEPVVTLAGRSELLAAMFFLLAWISFRRQRMALCAVAFFLSLLSKENAIAFPAVMALDMWIHQRDTQNLKQSVLKLLPICLSAMLYLGLRVWVLGALGVPKAAQYLSGGLTFVQRELTSGRAFLKMFQLLLAPVDVTGDYDFNSIPVATLTDWLAWTGLSIVMGTIILAVAMVKRRPELTFAILFFFIAMLPTSNWIMPTALIMSERALYLPSLGVCLIAGWRWAALPNRRLRGLLGVSVMSVAALLCVAHNYIWRDNFTYFENMVRVLPNNLRGRQGYGTALAERGRLEEARQQFDAGLQIQRTAPLLVGLGQALMQIDHDCHQARPALHEALTHSPQDPFASWLLAACFEKEGSLLEAEAHYRRAVANAHFPDPKLLTDWGRVLERMARREEAQAAYRRAALLR